MAKAALAPDLVAFDPMVYDIMRETATELGGGYVWLSRNASTETEREAAKAAQIALWRDVNSVSGRDLATIQAKTAEYRSRLRQLRATA
ncbi:hypothetical protein DC31_08555 [Microbacterium sp. CH12i]|uniref:hypothetical protein n=1 Tax=Microbacterium sp. CH12i TaxID=1479651 RepID=UPI000460DBCC|nr:hypothetical protein [Microbacterium sp. CH12i]KDA06673.1 hypothetical protein DC31_08555 [Microbacterium sp. CH12i]